MYSLFLSHRAERHYTFSMGPRIRDGTGMSKYITFFKSKDKAPYPIKMLGGVRTAINTLMKFTATTSFKETTPPPSSFDLPPSCLTASSLFDELLQNTQSINQRLFLYVDNKRHHLTYCRINVVLELHMDKNSGYCSVYPHDNLTELFFSEAQVNFLLLKFDHM